MEEKKKVEEKKAEKKLEIKKKYNHTILKRGGCGKWCSSGSSCYEDAYSG